MQFRYDLNDRPPFAELLILGFQWFALSIPTIAIIGKIVGAVQALAPIDQIGYIQKMLFVVSVALFFQILWGHRLPLILGPSTVLLIGIISSQGFEADAVYSSILLGGLILTALSISGLFRYLQRLFTPRVIATVLILIALTLAPTVMNLITVAEQRVPPIINLAFSIALTMGLFVCYRFMRGIWRSTVILWAIIGGSTFYFLIFPQCFVAEALFWGSPVSLFFSGLTTHLSIEPGVLISFLFCFFALSINDLGSIQSMKELVDPPRMGQRISRGITLTGLANVAAGFFGVIGPVNFSLSPGVITATGNASRFTLLPASMLLFLLSFSPFVVSLMGNIPPVVVGSVLVYILSYQVAAGLIVAFQPGKTFELRDGLVVGLPILLGTIVAFLPASVLSAFPPVLRPIIGNGFVIGVISTLTLEHGIFFLKYPGNP
ncbi:uracil-xanthine permease family protein [Syntrophorhabdus aromaticivorans]|uniref:uracil-xanthine permease family protein n=1 Tax=Syntrophorhabdus aromaticivorans TaxID=328301 RepID=UPI000428190C|nr:solute carrier family 23 protein [Syntrophorhabdus aromaticivorans]